jgi:hypothetical protein
MRKFMFGLAAALALGLGALASEPAQAQGFSITVASHDDDDDDRGYRYRPRYRYGYAPVYERPYRHWRRAHYYRRAYRPYRPYRPAYFAPGYGYGVHCKVRRERYFNGFRWVTDVRRICY